MIREEYYCPCSTCHHTECVFTGSEDSHIKCKDYTPQEPILDKIKGQIKDYLRGVEITLEVLVENDPLRPKMEGAKDTLEECLELIDKAESEVEDGNNSR